MFARIQIRVKHYVYKAATSYSVTLGIVNSTPPLTRPKGMSISAFSN